MDYLLTSTTGAGTTGALWIWGCIALTLFIAFGLNAAGKVWLLNKKHHIITWDEDAAQIADEEDDDD